MLEAEAARALLDERALNREIAKVYAPDTWFLKRGTTPAALRHALIGNAFTGARRIGVHFVDGGDFFVRDPRRLGAVVLDPEETRLGPDAASMTYQQLDAAIG